MEPFSVIDVVQEEVGTTSKRDWEDIALIGEYQEVVLVMTLTATGMHPYSHHHIQVRPQLGGEALKDHLPLDQVERTITALEEQAFIMGTLPINFLLVLLVVPTMYRASPSLCLVYVGSTHHACWTLNIKRIILCWTTYWKFEVSTERRCESTVSAEPYTNFLPTKADTKTPSALRFRGLCEPAMYSSKRLCVVLPFRFQKIGMKARVQQMLLTNHKMTRLLAGRHQRVSS